MLLLLLHTVDGMAQVQDVKADLDATHALCGSCRVQLRAVDQEVVEGSLRIIQLQRRLKNMQVLANASPSSLTWIGDTGPPVMRLL